MSPTHRVVPAILTNNALELERMVRQAEGFASWVQFDIMDGLFVPSQSIFSAEVVAAEPGFAYDIHIMAYHPESYFTGFRLAGARRFTFHYEAIPNAVDWARYVKSFGLEVGLALNPETPAEVVTTEVATTVDTLLLLSVSPGYYGQPFIPDVLNKAKEIRQMHHELTIGLDGGINDGNIAEVARAGVDEICIGSAIFGDVDPANAYRQLLAQAEQGWQEKDTSS